MQQNTCSKTRRDPWSQHADTTLQSSRSESMCFPGLFVLDVQDNAAQVRLPTEHCTRVRAKYSLAPQTFSTHGGANRTQRTGQDHNKSKHTTTCRSNYGTNCHTATIRGRGICSICLNVIYGKRRRRVNVLSTWNICLAITIVHRSRRRAQLFST